MGRQSNKSLGIKKAPSSFSLFSSHVCKAGVRDPPLRRVKGKHLSKKLDNMKLRWQNMPDAEKDKYKEEYSRRNAEVQNLRAVLTTKEPLPVPVPDEHPDDGQPIELEIFWQAGTLRASKLLGQGTFGAVYECKSISGAKFAVKMFKRCAGDSFDDEVAAFEKLRQHPNLVTWYGSVTSADNQLGILFELGTSLRQWLKQNPLPQLQLRQEPRSLWKHLCLRWQLALQLAHGLSFLHRSNLVHGDVKISNAIMQLGTNMAQWCDLGKAAKCGTIVTGNGIYSPLYRAPELGRTGGDRQIRIGPFADVWAYGCTLFMILCPSPTSDLFPDLSVLYNRKFLLSRLSKGLHYEGAGQAIIAEMLQESVPDRMTLQTFCDKAEARIRSCSDA